MSRRKRTKLAALTVEDIASARAALEARADPMHIALFEWIYTNGARASEPGQQLIEDVDLRRGTAMLVHLKGGLEPTPVALATRCKNAVALWLSQRDSWISKLRSEQLPYIFPSGIPGKCYVCKGTGQRQRHNGQMVPCHHCGATGQRWGLSRYEVAGIIGGVLEAAGVSPHLRFPHILRHSAVTHMLDAGWNPADIRLRVGHKSVETTFKYMQATKRAQEDLDRALG